MRHSLVKKRECPIREQVGIFGIDLTSIAGSSGVNRTAIQHVDLLRGWIAESQAKPNGLIHEPPCGIVATNYTRVIQPLGLMSELMALRFAQCAEDDRTVMVLDSA